jgi:exonuclease SbcD
MRLLFLADTHLGFDLPSRPRVLRRRRGDDFFENYERALAPACRGGVDAVLHGGDLLYRSRVPAWLAEAALAPLKRIATAGVPVLLVPGNHERSQLPYPLLACHEGLHVFARPRSVVLQVRGVRVEFVGFPYTSDVRLRFRDLFNEATREVQASDIRVLCMHQCVEGGTCGPGNFVFRCGPDVIRAGDLPRDVAVTLSGHLHRYQLLRPPDRSPVIYAGSTERTSFAEAGETKGFVVIELTRTGMTSLDFRPLPARPMVMRTITLNQQDSASVRDRVAEAIESTPADAVVQLRVAGSAAPLTAAMLREVAGTRTVTVAGSFAARRNAHARDILAAREVT